MGGTKPWPNEQGADNLGHVGPWINWRPSSCGRQIERRTQVKAQAVVLVPLIRKLETEIRADRARSILREALSEYYRSLATSWVEGSGGDRMAFSWSLPGVHHRAGGVSGS